MKTSIQNPRNNNELHGGGSVFNWVMGRKCKSKPEKEGGGGAVPPD